jgi:hypothetical protein
MFECVKEINRIKRWTRVTGVFEGTFTKPYLQRFENTMHSWYLVLIHCMKSNNIYSFSPISFVYYCYYSMEIMVENPRISLRE